jgi:hypothetical protein
MGMVEINVDFVKHGGNPPKHIPSSKTEAGQQHLAQFNKKNN